MLGLALYEDTLCPGCGQPKHLAWHSHTAGEWEDPGVVCHACTAVRGTETSYSLLELQATDAWLATLPAFDLDDTVTRPEPRATT